MSDLPVSGRLVHVKTDYDEELVVRYDSSLRRVPRRLRVKAQPWLGYRTWCERCLRQRLAALYAKLWPTREPLDTERPYPLWPRSTPRSWRPWTDEYAQEWTDGR